MTSHLRHAPQPIHLADALVLAQLAPKVSGDDPRVGHMDILRAQLESTPYPLGADNPRAVLKEQRFDYPQDGTLQQLYGNDLLDWKGWEDFAASNADLVSNIGRVLGLRNKVERPVVDTFTQYVMQIMHNSSTVMIMAYQTDKAKLDAAAEHPLGVAAISLFVHDELKPLEHEATRQLTLAGFEPQENTWTVK